jgi:hypothetical protein
LITRRPYRIANAHAIGFGQFGSQLSDTFIRDDLLAAEFAGIELPRH